MAEASPLLVGRFRMRGARIANIKLSAHIARGFRAPLPRAACKTPATFSARPRTSAPAPAHPSVPSIPAPGYALAFSRSQWCALSRLPS